MKFLSDNTASVCPEIMAALLAADQGRAYSYGEDACSRLLDTAFSEHFAHPVRAFAVATGTAANALALATLTPPYGVVFTPQGSHILENECGACEFFSAGARLTALHAVEGRLTPQALAQALDALVVSVHSVQPSAVSISQCTELGTVYTPGQLADLAQLAHARGLRLHVDGARFANAVAHLGVQPAELTWRAGVDVLSFGATKNGALAADAVVFFDPQLAGDFELRRKRAGHLLSKHRYLTAQLLAYLRDDLWLRNAARGNALAQRIAAAAGSRVQYPVQSNAVFLRLDAAEHAHLCAAGFEYHDWGARGSNVFRFVVSWDQPEEEVDALCAALVQPSS